MAAFLNLRPKTLVLHVLISPIIEIQGWRFRLLVSTFRNGVSGASLPRMRLLEDAPVPPSSTDCLPFRRFIERSSSIVDLSNWPEQDKKTRGTQREGIRDGNIARLLFGQRHPVGRRSRFEFPRTLVSHQSHLLVHVK